MTWWDGESWRVVSPDRLHWWDGSAWHPIPALVPVSPAPRTEVPAQVHYPTYRPVDDAARRRRIRVYFEGSAGQWWLLAAGVSLLVVALLARGNANIPSADLEPVVGYGAVLGFSITIAAVVWLASRYATRPDDRTIDAWLREDIEQLKPRALERLNLDWATWGNEEGVADPLVIQGLPVWNADTKGPPLGVPKEDWRWKRGRDRAWRFSVNRILIFFLLMDKLSSYHCDHNFMRGVALNEGDDEFYYRDIVSTSTREMSTAYRLTEGYHMMVAQYFAVTVPSGDRIEAIVGLLGVVKSTRMPAVDTGADNTIKALRNQIREKKLL